jgi:hypothetical protein
MLGALSPIATGRPAVELTGTFAALSEDLGLGVDHDLKAITTRVRAGDLR